MADERNEPDDAVSEMAEAWTRKIEDVAGTAERLGQAEARAFELMQSADKADQLEAQMMMQQIQQEREAISEALEATSDTAAGAIDDAFDSYDVDVSAAADEYASKPVQDSSGETSAD